MSTRASFAVSAFAGCTLTMAVLSFISATDDGSMRGGHSQPTSVASSSALETDAASTDAEIRTILARPLFDPDRHSKLHVAVAAPVILPRLAGTLISPARRMAIFTTGGTDKPVSVTEGGRIGDFVVESITPGRAELTGPDGHHVLQTALTATKPPQSREVPK